MAVELESGQAARRAAGKVAASIEWRWRERGARPNRCPGMRWQVADAHSGGGAHAVDRRIVTQGRTGGLALGHRYDQWTRALPHTRWNGRACGEVCLRCVHTTQPAMSPVAGAVVARVTKLTCSAISYPAQQGGEHAMSLAPEAR